MKEKTIIRKRVLYLRKFCLIHRYLYYIKCHPLIEDCFYDQREKELKDLVEKHFDILKPVRYGNPCPSTTVGSSNEEDYTRLYPELVNIAEELLKTDEKERTKS